MTDAHNRAGQTVLTSTEERLTPGAGWKERPGKAGFMSAGSLAGEEKKGYTEQM